MSNGRLKDVSFFFAGLGILIFSVAALIWVLKSTAPGPRSTEVSSYPIARTEYQIGSGEFHGEGSFPPIMGERIEKALRQAMNDPAVIDELQKEIEKFVQSEEFQEQLRESLEKQREPSFDGQGPDLVALDKIKFPENKTKDALKKYIRDILDISKNQNTFSPNDPQVSLLAKVGEENIDLLIEASVKAPWERYHVTQAIIRLASPRSKQKIIDALPGNYELIKAVVRNGWEAEVKDLLVEELKKKSYFPGDKYIPEEWVTAVAEFKDPSTYDALINHFVNGGSRYPTYEIIKDLPGIKLDTHVQEAWENSLNSHEWERVGMAIVAVEYGQKEALQVLIDNLNSPQFEYYSSKMRYAIIKHTEAWGSNSDLIEWYKSNKGNLVFDKKNRKFRKKT